MDSITMAIPVSTVFMIVPWVGPGFSFCDLTQERAIARQLKKRANNSGDQLELVKGGNLWAILFDPEDPADSSEFDISKSFQYIGNEGFDDITSGRS